MEFLRQPRSSWLLRTTFALILSGRAIGLALAPVLLVTQPVALLVLSPFIVHLVLVASLIDSRLYVAVALPVCLFQCAIGYLLGTRGSQYFEKMLTGANWTRIAALWLHRAAPVVLFAIPGPITCAVAGVTRVRVVPFYLSMVTAQIFWVGACLIFGLALTQQIAVVQQFVLAHLLPLTAFTTVGVVTHHLYGRWRTSKH